MKRSAGREGATMKKLEYDRRKNALQQRHQELKLYLEFLVQMEQVVLELLRLDQQVIDEAPTGPQLSVPGQAGMRMGRE